MENLNPLEISRLPWPKGSRYGIASRATRMLLHSSDSKAWILGMLKREAPGIEWQFVQLN